MNRWPYQSVLRLVFNLDTEREGEAQREHEMKRRRELHYISHSGRNLPVEPLASPTVAHRCFGCGTDIPPGMHPRERAHV